MYLESLVEKYEKNTIWGELFSINFSNSKFDRKQLESMVDFYTTQIDKIISSKTSWENTFLPFKKLVHLSEYFINLSEIYNISHNVKLKDKPIVFVLQNTSNEIWNIVNSNTDIIKKFKELLILDISDKKKNTIKSWLNNFFENNKNNAKKNQYNKYYSKLTSNIEVFHAHNEDINESNRNLIFVPQKNIAFIQGVPKDLLEEALKKAKSLKFKGWVFCINNHTIDSICSHSDNRDFRKLAYVRFQATQSNGQHFTKNNAVIKNIMLDKHNIAKIFNKKNYPELVISNHQLNNTNKVLSYLDQNIEKLYPIYSSFMEQIKSLALKDGIRKIKPWDISYYIQILNQKQQGNIKFKNYFNLDEFLTRFLNFLEKTFHLSIVKTTKKIGECETFHIKDNKSKKEMFLVLSLLKKTNKSGCYQYDISNSIKIGNFLTPSIQYIEADINPKELSFSHLACLVHEFGHCLHSFFSKNTDSHFKSKELSWDLIEAPSQFLEMLMFDYNFLSKMTSNGSFNKAIFDSIIKSELYLEPLYTYRSLIKNKIIFNTFLNFQPYSKVNIHKSVAKEMEDNLIIYNISQDNYMSYDNYLNDYAPCGYIYLFSAQIAQIIPKNNLRYTFEHIFNNNHNGKLLKFIKKSSKTSILDYCSRKNQLT